MHILYELHERSIYRLKFEKAITVSLTIKTEYIFKIQITNKKLIKTKKKN